MSVVILSKSGQSLTTRASGRKNPRGEQFGTEDLVRHLVEVGHQVVYFGLVDEGLATQYVVRPDTKGIDSFMTNREQQERFNADAERLRAALHSAGWDGVKPPLWIEVCGMPASCSFVNNPRGISPQMSSMRYTAPMLGCMLLMKSPRISVVADVRSYPRDAEMSDGWPQLRPAALLDNYVDGPREVSTQIAFLPYLRRSVNSRSYSWAYLEWREPSLDPKWLVGGVSHCHIATGFRKRRRAEAWDTILGPHGELFSYLTPGRCVMRGEGWEEWWGARGFGRSVFPGPTDWCGVQETLLSSVISPVVAPDDHFVTNKPYIIAAHGCIPVLASGCPHEWDPGQDVVTSDTLRCKNWRDAAWWAEQEVTDRAEYLESLRCTMVQDFSIMDSLIEDYERDLLSRDKQEWWNRYGGYR
jgi:hypothetical protein